MLSVDTHVDRRATRSESPKRSSSCTSVYTYGDLNRIMLYNPLMRRDPRMTTHEFVTCSEQGCNQSSGVAEYNSMTIRTGFSFCMRHVKQDEVTTRIASAGEVGPVTVIFYDIELSRDGEIEQLAAHTVSAESHSVFVRTPVRTSTSPYLKRVPAMVHSMIAVEPGKMIRDFIEWTQRYAPRDSDMIPDLSRVVLVAHNGACHDHVHLVKTMIKVGVNPPKYRFSDSLAFFKLLISMYQSAKLGSLASKYVAWHEHIPHDAYSDALILRLVTMVAFPDTIRICVAFSIECEDFKKRVGLNMYTPMNANPFPDPMVAPITVMESGECTSPVSDSIASSI